MDIAENKTTLYPSLEIDEGMFHLINKGYNTSVYLRGEEKSFYIKEAQKLNAGNYETLIIILNFRDKKVRDKIWDIIKNGSVYILYGKEYKKKKKNYFHNQEIITTKRIVCLYISGCNFCPGISFMKEKIEPINKFLLN